MIAAGPRPFAELSNRAVKLADRRVAALRRKTECTRMTSKPTGNGFLHERLQDELVETIDEELELEIDDARLAELLRDGTDEPPSETVDRHMYFKELLRLQKELVK